jgi:prophage antirepressor-like protein
LACVIANEQAIKEGTVGLALTLTFDGHRVRMVGTPERPEWIAKDVCRVLDLHNGRTTLAAVVPADEKGVHAVDTLGGRQEVATVTEPGLYRLITRSRKPAAQRFQAWLFGDVLPCIRQHGCYPAPSALAPKTREHRIALALVEANEIIAELQVAKRTLDAITESDGDMSLQDAARKMSLHPNKAIWQWEEDGLLFRGAHGTLTPHVRYSCSPHGNGVFRFVTTEAVDGRTYGQTKVTPKGLAWLAERYAAAEQQERPALVAASPVLQ